jgi:hypothetical protein
MVDLNKVIEQADRNREYRQKRNQRPEVKEGRRIYHWARSQMSSLVNKWRDGKITREQLERMVAEIEKKKDFYDNELATTGKCSLPVGRQGGGGRNGPVVQVQAPTK